MHSYRYLAPGFPFISLISELASSLRNIVFADQVVYNHEERGRLLELLEEHISSNIVKVSLRV